MPAGILPAGNILLFPERIMRKTLKYFLIAAVVLLAAAQFVRPELTAPVANPASAFEAVASPNPEVASMLKRACYDCHSYNTVWPWHSRVAPASWLVAADVKEGRARLNFSEWSFLSAEMAQTRLRSAHREVKDGRMPLWQYRLIHWDAKPTEQEIAALSAAANK